MKCHCSALQGMEGLQMEYEPGLCLIYTEQDEDAIEGRAQAIKC